MIMIMQKDRDCVEVLIVFSMKDDKGCGPLLYFGKSLRDSVGLELKVNAMFNALLFVHLNLNKKGKAVD